MADRNITATTNIDTLAAALTMAARDRSRYTLNCLCLCSEGIVATDGSVLFVCKWDASVQWEGEPFLLSRDDVKTVLGLAKVHKAKTVAFNINGRAEVFGQAFDAAAGLFPAWQQVVPTEPAEDSGELDIDRLAELTAAVKRAWRRAGTHDATDNACRLAARGQAWVCESSDGYVYGLLMTLREKRANKGR